MRLLIQRVDEASVKVGSHFENKIGKGLLVFVGIKNTDSLYDIKYLINKLINLRIFENDEKLNNSIIDVKGEILLVSQFTLYADTKNGNRPSFTDAMKFEKAQELYELFIKELEKTKIKFKTGMFGADMRVSLINNGPVTIIMDSKE